METLAHLFENNRDWSEGIRQVKPEFFLELARQQAPGATFVKADMTALDFPPGTFDAVVAFYSIVHVPRGEQPALLRRIHGWLKPGGPFLATWATSSWEGSESDWEGWGAPMWWSHYGQDDNLDMLRAAGFDITSAEVRTHTFAGGEESWLWEIISAPPRHSVTSSPVCSTWMPPGCVPSCW